MKIATRLAAGFFVLLALMIAMAALGFWRLGDMAQRVNNIIRDDAKEERVVWDWFSETKANSVRALVLTRTEDEDIKKLLAPTMDATSKRITELQKQVEALLSNDEAKAIFAEVGEKRKAYLSARGAAVDARKAGNGEEANRIVDTRMVPAINDYVGVLQKMVDYQKRAIETSGDNMTASAVSGRRLYVVSATIVLIIGLLLAWWLYRSITRPLNEAVEVAQTVASGDLTATIKADTNDEAGQLMRALSGMNSSLANIVSEARNATDTIAVASREIAMSNSNLSTRTEQQASSLEQTASSVEEFTSTVKQNAENARQAAVLAAGASNVAQKGGQMVANVVNTMNDISESSKKIADIISVIDGIAFQTNILALNAAVEAARAGDQGRGFAVVASEVRTLAQRSASAAKEIKTLIGDSVGKVGDGTRIVTETGNTMMEVVESVQRVNDIIAQIATSSQEQSVGIEQVNQAIMHMDDTTQQNAALVEQAAATAENMAAQAELLAKVVARFKLRSTAIRETYAAPERTHRETPTTAARSPMMTKPKLAYAAAALPHAEGAAPRRASMRHGEEGGWKEF